jgi:hypothetical protein
VSIRDRPQSLAGPGTPTGLSVCHARWRFTLYGEAARYPMGETTRQRVATDAIAACDRILAEQLGGDPRVYLVRHLRLQASERVPDAGREQALSERVGRRLAAAVLHRLASADSDIQCFESRADYIAQFAVDLLAGRAWDRWYYRPFSRLRAELPGATLKNVFAEHRAHIPRILAALDQNNALGPVLVTLGPKGATELWAEGLDRLPTGGQTLRPLVEAALALADELDLWVGVRIEAPTVLRELAGSLPQSDWRDRRALSVTVHAVLAELSRQGYLRAPTDDKERWADAVPALDWLDLAWLQDSLQVVWGTTASVGNESAKEAPAGNELPVHRPIVETPRQRRLLADLLAIAESLRDEDVALDAQVPTGAANALRLYARLVARFPTWQDDPLATTVIEQVLMAWADRLRASPCEEWLAPYPGEGAVGPAPPAVSFAERSTSEKQEAGEKGGPGATTPLTPEDETRTVWTAPSRPTAASNGTQPVRDRDGPRRQQIVDELMRMSPTEGGWDATRPSRAQDLGGGGGAALVLRAAQDVRLWSILSAEAHEGAEITRQAALAAILLHLMPATEQGEVALPRGLPALCGGFPTTFDELGEALQALDIERLTTAWLETLVKQRALEPGPLHVYRLSLPLGRDALVGADTTGTLFPFSTILPGERAGATPRHRVDQWSAVYEAAAGESPRWITTDPSLQDTLNETGAIEDDLLQAHVAGQKRLMETLGALSGRIPLPEHDLLLALMTAGLLRLWVRWLHNFSASSVPYLLAQFIRRSGTLIHRDDELVVLLAPQPTDVLLEMAGYFDPLVRLPWLDGLQVHFQIVR